MKFVRVANTLFSVDKIRSITQHQSQIDVVFDNGSVETQFAPNEAIAHERFMELEADLNGPTKTGTYAGAHPYATSFDDELFDGPCCGPCCDEEVEPLPEEPFIRGVVYSASLPEEVVDEIKKWMQEQKGGKQ